MVTAGKFNKLLRLASGHLSFVDVRKVDIGSDRIFYCGMNSLSKAIIDLMEKAFSEYLRKVRLLGYPDRDARETFRLVAERKISHKIYSASAQILFSD